MAPNNEEINYIRIRSRFLPELITPSHAAAIVREDIPITWRWVSTEVLEYITQYAGNAEPLPIKYKPCNICECMIGYDHHAHCNRCMYPAINLHNGHCPNSDQYINSCCAALKHGDRS